MKNITFGTTGYSYKFWGPAISNCKSVNNYYRKGNYKQSWLKKYSADLQSVEINVTRYRKLTPKMCKTWLSNVPENFIFTIKIGTYITHNKKLCDFAI